MNLSLNWIREYIKLPELPAKELSLALTMSTVEVEEVIEQEKLYEGIVVGKVLEVVKHPNADLLQVCAVDVRSERLQIVCGGTNVVNGMLVAVATVGSKVRWHGTGELVALEKTKIRGVESFGMIVSSDEIGLADLFPKKEEREILDLSHYRVSVGAPLAKALGLDDTIFVIDSKSMTHRADLWSQYGLAREFAAIYSLKLKSLMRKPITRATEADRPLSISINDTDLCYRYSAVVLEGVTVGPSPWWLKRDLHAMGVRSVNNVVDVTNYVMFLMGQPLHAFDYEKINGAQIRVGRVPVKHAFEGLNGKTYTIPLGTLMIQDAKNSLAVAGIIGGKSSEITGDTKTIVLESANFAASPLRRSALALGVRTEASARFEKKLDPELTVHALEVAVNLLQQIEPGIVVASELHDQRFEPAAVATLEVSLDFLTNRLGKALDPKIIGSILKRLSFDVHFKRGIFVIGIPTFRQRDIAIPEDIVEEVARIYGYGSIEPSLPRVEIPKPLRDDVSQVERVVKTFLALAHAYTEVYNYSFADPYWSEKLSLNTDLLELKNYLNPEQHYLRASLVPNLCARAVDNSRWFDAFRFFEFGRIFLKQDGEYPVNAVGDSFLPKQPLMVAGIEAAKTSNPDSVYYAVKSMIDQLCEYLKVSVVAEAVDTVPFSTHAFELRFHEKIIGRYGLLKTETIEKDMRGMQVAWWELNFEYLVKFSDFSRTYQAPSKYPSIVRDIALILGNDVVWGDIEKAIRGSSEILQSIALFDVFESESLGAHKKSLAFRLTFGSEERTLESGEVDQIVDKITKLLHQKFKAVAR